MKITDINLYALYNAYAAAHGEPMRQFNKTSIPHIKRCVADGLIEKVAGTKGDWVLTDKGRRQLGIYERNLPSHSNKALFPANENPMNKHSKPDLSAVYKLGEKLGVNWSTSKFTPCDLWAGTAVELEHMDVTGGNLEQTMRIALSHLRECPTYYQQLAKMEKKCPAKGRSKNPSGKPMLVHLASAANPDFEETSEWRGGYQQGGKPGANQWQRVGSFEEASQAVQRYIMANGLGGGNWVGGEIVDEATREPVGRVGYNGRVWPPGPWQAGMRALYYPQGDGPYDAPAPAKKSRTRRSKNPHQSYRVFTPSRKANPAARKPAKGKAAKPRPHQGAGTKFGPELQLTPPPVDPPYATEIEIRRKVGKLDERLLRKHPGLLSDLVPWLAQRAEAGADVDDLEEAIQALVGTDRDDATDLAKELQEAGVIFEMAQGETQLAGPGVGKDPPFTTAEAGVRWALSNSGVKPSKADILIAKLDELPLDELGEQSRDELSEWLSEHFFDVGERMPQETDVIIDKLKWANVILPGTTGAQIRYDASVSGKPDVDQVRYMRGIVEHARSRAQLVAAHAVITDLYRRHRVPASELPAALPTPRPKPGPFKRIPKARSYASPTRPVEDLIAGDRVYEVMTPPHYAGIVVSLDKSKPGWVVLTVKDGAGKLFSKKVKMGRPMALESEGDWMAHQGVRQHNPPEASTAKHEYVLVTYKGDYHQSVGGILGQKSGTATVQQIAAVALSKSDLRQWYDPAPGVAPWLCVLDTGWLELHVETLSKAESTRMTIILSAMKGYPQAPARRNPATSSGSSILQQGVAAVKAKIPRRNPPDTEGYEVEARVDGLGDWLLAQGMSTSDMDEVDLVEALGELGVEPGDVGDAMEDLASWH